MCLRNRFGSIDDIKVSKIKNKNDIYIAMRKKYPYNKSEVTHDD